MTGSISLQDFPLLREVSIDALALLDKFSLHQTIPAQQHLFFQDDDNPPVMFIHSGQIRVYRISPNGREQTLLIVGAGDSINLPLVFSAKHQSHANAITISDCQLTSIAQNDFYNAIGSNNELAMAVLKNISEKIQGLVQLTHDLSLTNVRSRLAKFLISQTQDNDSVQWTQEDIANQIGTVREIVSRNLRLLTNEGVITFQRHNIQILDLERLQLIAEE
ncbi:MAG: Crp/Fnr family transcriptional regulator [Anaerolineaceae bacterium]|nr:Crp/Fnr family transcriptional regulator [Anaerolineaceae bacterium]